MFYLVAEPLIGSRNKFDTQRLIYAQNRWLKPSECLWNCSVQISGLVPLEPIFPNLKAFFVDVLQVRLMDVNVLIQQLAALARIGGSNTDEVKRIMLGIGQILGSKPETKVQKAHMDTLKKTAFLPVRSASGGEMLSVAESFCINDHERYGKIFGDRVRMLDFEYADLTSLHPFFERLELTDRYISRLVSVHTTVESPEFSEHFTNFVRSCAYVLSW